MELVSYSKAQKRAIEHGKGPLIVLAGPGSGKTFVITHRVKYLIEHYKISPNNIMLVTFSRAAADEMRERFLSLSPDNIGVTFGTFHSIFFNILKLAYGYSGEQIATDSIRLSVMEKILFSYKDLNLLSSDNINLVLSEISLVKGERINLDFFYPKSCSKEIFINIYKSYEEELALLKKIDFDDMLLMAYDLLISREDIRKACISKYKYILIDEFQDINSLQYELIKLLLSDENNLTIVGDDDQSIYSFRGARPDIMLGFEKDFPKVEKVILDINFRSVESIVAASSKLIKNNKKRFEKNISSYRGLGKNIALLNFYSPSRQAEEIIKDIKTYISLGYEYKDIAILYRTNIQPRILIEKFMSLIIPFNIKDNVPNIYEHFIAKDIIAYLKLAIGDVKRSNLLRIANKPNRYIKREAFEREDVDIYSLKKYYQTLPYMRERIDDLENEIKVLKNLSLKRAIIFIRKGIAYDKYLEDYADYHGIEVDDLFNILDELETLASAYEDINSWFVHIEEYKEKIKEFNFNKNNNENSINLMTFHASKGLEFKIVYIIDVNKGIVPYKKAKSKEEVEEERRMFYVAMTRAKDRLIISSTAKGDNTKTEKSEFLKEIY